MLHSMTASTELLMTLHTGDLLLLCGSLRPDFIAEAVANILEALQSCLRTLSLTEYADWVFGAVPGQPTWPS